jgi:hypothetical protein
MFQHCPALPSLNATAPPELPADYETSGMARLRREAHARMLGNGLCTRPVELDCRMESACQTCAYFRTTVEFLPILTRERDHARERGQTERAAAFDGLIQRVEATTEDSRSRPRSASTFADAVELAELLETANAEIHPVKVAGKSRDGTPSKTLRATSDDGRRGRRR